MESSDYLKNYRDGIEAEKKFKKEHPILAFLCFVFDYFRYRVPFHLSEAISNVKYGFQRMFRGYDDYDVWGYWQSTAERNIKVLKRLKATKVGAPYTEDPDNVLTTPDVPSTSDGVDSTWFTRYDEALDLMIEGFQAIIDQDNVFIVDEDGNYDREASQKEKDRLEAIWKKGSVLYVANFRGIWD